MASHSIMKKTIKIDGMTCVSCENRIERKLQNTPGILEAKVSYTGGTAALTYDSRMISFEEITDLIEKLDYKVKRTHMVESRTNTVKTIGVVFMLSVFLFSSGMILSGIALPGVTESAKGENVAVIKDGVQIITTGLSSGRYVPITVQKGIPVKWTIKANDGEINGCNNRIIIPKYNKELKLAVGGNEIEFTPTDSDIIPYSCWMGMIRSQITVVDDLENVTPPTLLPDKEGAVYSIPTENIAVAKMENGIQHVEINVDQNGFSPAVVVLQAGVETEWVINAISPGEGTSVLLFPKYYAQIDMREGANEISLVPEGDFDFSTADASYFGYVKVVDNLQAVDLNKIRQEIGKYTPVFFYASQNGASPPSCH